MHAPSIAALVLALVGAAPLAYGAAPHASGCLDAGCHRVLLDQAGVHRPVVEEDCANCHSVDVAAGDVPEYHVGAVAGPLAAARAEEDVCGVCHEPALRGMRAPPRFGEERSAPAASPAAHRHGPLVEGHCGDCHRAHGESAAELVRGELPAGAYAPYAPDRYSACLGACHAAEIIEASPAGSATAFRNGERNLHRVHSVEPRLGRSCRLCHDPHVSSNAALVRSAMPFGGELLTLQFEARERGGRCTTSCHIPLEYDREEAVPSRMRTAASGPTTERP